ncbi:MAG TPA: thiamine phosphate synthase [Kiritimatiellia bacterium]|nr:MAG: Thiamine-phosphate synthase [Verrucomicrobia bacterium ADurb.Bin070]HPB10313.1 thiamine phosphate synthase [Kiritimatiellia bacterium]HPO37111.1 thiamine phosphate synthase [Kiritimatiellia bacterium]HQA37318.1 thiamine phosphate synthase [Kiritimatiellia bacterium]HQL49764.1 thiamine phosphate synthase [Kiritimatiellia bacterium]
MNDLRERLVLYAVTDRAWLAAARATLDGQVEEAVRGGATMVQLREKGMDDAAYAALARRVKAVTDVFGVPLIVNDSLEAAITSDAAGLHVGQADGDVREIRVRLGPGKILGVSTQTVAQARAAEADGADYLGVGAVFPTATKPDAAEIPLSELAAICAAVRIPVVAIGGIHAGNALLLRGCGLAGICVVSALFARPGQVCESARELRALAEAVTRPA